MGQGLAVASGTASKSLTTQGLWQPSFGVQGLDVSEYQPSVDWPNQWSLGARFAYIKATEGNYYTNPLFGSQYSGSRSAGLIRGAYHFANPAASSGADQARIFVASGGGWSSDGFTMPPVLDFEGNPYAGKTINGYYQGNTCYDMSPGALTAWAQDFSNTMLALTGRLPVIYTGNYWWRDCVGNPSGFGNNPLWVASYPLSPSDDAGPLPSSWTNYSLWQYADSGRYSGDQNVWNGDYASLQRFATGFTVDGSGSIGRSWLALGGASGKLGYAITPEICGLTGGGCFQGFQNGTIHYAPGIGAYATWGGIRAAWGKLGYENGKLGYPVTNEICGLTGGGCYQGFQNGTIHYAPGIGAYATWGGIRATWGKLGYENGKLGYPVENPGCGATGAMCVQKFQHGKISDSGAVSIE